MFSDVVSLNGIMHARHRDTSAIIEELLLNLPYRANGCFLWLVGVCNLKFGGVSGVLVFRGVNRDPSDIWSFVLFHVSCVFRFGRLFVTIL